MCTTKCARWRGPAMRDRRGGRGVAPGVEPRAERVSCSGGGDSDLGLSGRGAVVGSGGGAGEPHGRHDAAIGHHDGDGHGVEHGAKCGRHDRVRDDDDRLAGRGTCGEPVVVRDGDGVSRCFESRLEPRVAVGQRAGRADDQQCGGSGRGSSLDVAVDDVVDVGLAAEGRGVAVGVVRERGDTGCGGRGEPIRVVVAVRGRHRRSTGRGEGLRGAVRVLPLSRSTGRSDRGAGNTPFRAVLSRVLSRVILQSRASSSIGRASDF